MLTDSRGVFSRGVVVRNWLEWLRQSSQCSDVVAGLQTEAWPLDWIGPAKPKHGVRPRAVLPHQELPGAQPAGRWCVKQVLAVWQCASRWAAARLEETTPASAGQAFAADRVVAHLQLHPHPAPPRTFFQRSHDHARPATATTPSAGTSYDCNDNDSDRAQATEPPCLTSVIYGAVTCRACL